MQKKILNIVELLIIGLIMFSVFQFNKDSNSTHRFNISNNFVRIGIDLILLVILLFRAFQIVKSFKKEYFELGRLDTIEKVIYSILIISLLPDLITWYQWNYFANLYLFVLIIFFLPIVLWTVEIIERVSIKSNKIKNYGLSIILFSIPIIGYTIYLSRII